jgi:carboxyl-terminal processing protease
MNEKPRVTTAVAAVAALMALTGACASAPAPPPANPEPPPPAVPDHIQPPPFQATPDAGNRQKADDARTATHRAIFDAAWRLVRDKHYDKKLGGVDWAAQRRKYEPLALAAPSEASFYRTVNQMIGELGQSHMMIRGPGSDDDERDERAAGGDAAAFEQAITGIGDPGLTVRMIENRPTITAVRPGSSAERQGLLPGFIVTHIGGRDIRVPSEPSRPLRPVEERFALRRLAQQRLTGAVGSKVTINFLDNDDRAGEVMLIRDPPKAPPVRFGHVSFLSPEVRVSQLRDVAVLSFNIFLLEPVMGDIKKAIAGIRARGSRALIIDLRGNPGGHGSMSIPVAALLVEEPVTLGTLHFRDFNNVLTAKPQAGSPPFTGPVAILTDEGTASASEILAAGLQEAKRAVVVGDATLGAVLPSVVESLPGGAVLQYVVADFKTPKGVVLEGRGVQPDRRVIETRAGLKTGRDPVLDAALVAVRASRPR